LSDAKYTSHLLLVILFHMPKSIDDLEEIDSEYKGTVIKELSDSKAVEVIRKHD